MLRLRRTLAIALTILSTATGVIAAPERVEIETSDGLTLVAV